MADPVVRSFHDEAMRIARTTVQNKIQYDAGKGARRRDPQYKGLPDNSTGSRNAPFFVCKGEAPFPVSSASPLVRRVMAGAGNAGFLWNPEGRKYAKSILQRRAADIIAQQQMLPEQLELGEPDVTTGIIRSPFTGQLITADQTQLQPNTPLYQTITSEIQNLRLNIAEILDILGDSLPSEELKGAEEKRGAIRLGDEEVQEKVAEMRATFVGRDAWKDSRKLSALISNMNARITVVAPYLTQDALEEVFAAVADMITTLRPSTGQGAAITNAVRRLEDAKKYLERSFAVSSLPLKSRVERNEQLKKEFNIITGIIGKKELPQGETVMRPPVEIAAPGTQAAAKAAAETVSQQRVAGSKLLNEFISSARIDYSVYKQDFQREQVLIAAAFVINNVVNIPTNPSGTISKRGVDNILGLMDPAGKARVIAPLRDISGPLPFPRNSMLVIYNSNNKEKMNSLLANIHKTLKIKVRGINPIEELYPDPPIITVRRDFLSAVKALCSVQGLNKSVQDLANKYYERAEQLEEALSTNGQHTSTGDITWTPTLYKDVELKYPLPADIYQQITGRMPGGVEGVEERKDMEGEEEEEEY